MTKAHGRIGPSPAERLWLGATSDTTADLSAATQEASRLLRSAPFPAFARRVTAQVMGPDADLTTVRRRIDADPELRSRVLAIARSPAYGARWRDLREGFRRSGAAAVLEVVLAETAGRLMAAPDYLSYRVRDHCAGVAGIARVLGEHHPQVQQHLLFLAGLLHDLGSLLLLESRPDLDGERIAALTEPHDAVHHWEGGVLGFDHATLGGLVLEGWGIPEPVPLLVGLHHHEADTWVRAGHLGLQLALMRCAEHLDLALEQGGLSALRELPRLVRAPCFAYASLDASRIRTLWPAILAARRSACRLFSHQEGG